MSFIPFWVFYISCYSQANLLLDCEWPQEKYDTFSSVIARKKYCSMRHLFLFLNCCIFNSSDMWTLAAKGWFWRYLQKINLKYFRGCCGWVAWTLYLDNTMMKQTGKKGKSIASKLSLVLRTAQEGKLFFHLMITYSFVWNDLGFNFCSQWKYASKLQCVLFSISF